jgi:hypothetical protein
MPEKFYVQKHSSLTLLRHGTEICSPSVPRTHETRGRKHQSKIKIRYGICSSLNEENKRMGTGIESKKQKSKWE